MNDTEKKYSESELRELKSRKLIDGIDAWCSFYRENPHRFAADYLGLQLKPFQQAILCMMFKCVNTMFLACRGIGKTFLLAIFCVVMCILYPDSTICIASKTRGQAIEVITKIVSILMPKSPNLRNEIKDITRSQSETSITFKNGSRILVVTASDSARHNRATVLIVDEFRLVDKNIIDTILRKFLTATRHPGFLDTPEHKDYPLERTKELYASSCWYESHWSYELVRSYAVNMVRGRSYFVCAMPYQMAIKEKLLDRARVEDEMSESTFNSVTFQMEMEALFFRKGDGGLYNFDDIDKNRIIKYPYFPSSSDVRLPDKRLYVPSKREGEIRILSADIALMSSTKTKNDATSIFVNCMIPTGNNRYISNIVYADNNEGLRTEVQALKIRKLFNDFDCDYLVIDTRGLGLGVVDALMGDLYDANSGFTYGALSCCNNPEIASRCAVSNAPRVIWSVLGTSEFNSQCALGLREAIKQKSVRLLISEFDAEDALQEIKGYMDLNAGDALNVKLPYIQTSLLINELINLEYETKNNVIKVKEKTGMRKDRYSSLSYNIYVAKQIEREKTAEKLKNIKNVALYYNAPVKRKSTL